MPEMDGVSDGNASEWYVVLLITEYGQRVAITHDTDVDGPIVATAASKEEAVEQASQLAHLMGMPLYNSEMDVSM